MEKFRKRKINVNEDSDIIKKKKRNISTSINFNEKPKELSIRKMKGKSKESLISKETIDNKVVDIKRRYLIRQQKLITSYKFKYLIPTKFNRLIKLK